MEGRIEMLLGIKNGMVMQRNSENVADITVSLHDHAVLYTKKHGHAEKQ